MISRALIICLFLALAGTLFGLDVDRYVAELNAEIIHEAMQLLRDETGSYFSKGIRIRTVESPASGPGDQHPVHLPTEGRVILIADENVLPPEDFGLSPHGSASLSVLVLQTHENRGLIFFNLNTEGINVGDLLSAGTVIGWPEMNLANGYREFLLSAFEVENSRAPLEIGHFSALFLPQANVAPRSPGSDLVLFSPRNL